jgi:hypothetical protein
MTNPEDPLPPRHLAHLQIAEAYGCTPANVLAGLRNAVAAGQADPKVLWPFDGAHPDDSGYQAFFEVVREAYEKATSEKAAARRPEAPVFPALYPSIERRILTETKLPTGWEPAKARRTSLWFDGLSSRWMGEVAVARVRNGVVPQPLEISFRGSLVGVFGERDAVSVPFRVWIDGQPVARPNTKDNFLWKIDTSAFGPDKPGSGQLFAWTLLASDLKDGDHVLRIEPIFEGANSESELRIESVCSAGR